MKLKLMTLALLMAGSVFAQTPPMPPAGTGGGHGGRHGPGRKIPQCEGPVEACRKAGFIPGAHKPGDAEGEDMGLWRDCIDAVADGKKTVAGVDPTAAKACQAAKRAQNGKH